MEFLDEFESKPRFVLQSKHLPQSHDSDSSSPFSSSLNKPALIISLSFSLCTFLLAFFYFNFEPFASILLWLALSFLIGPFAPPSLTAGDIRVGLGPPIKETPKLDNEINEKPSRKSSKSVKKPSENAVKLDRQPEKSSSVDGFHIENKRDGFNKSLNGTKSEEESEWGEADEELLKKLMGKHPPGKPGRWEAIAEGFKGKHKVETVIAKAKETGGKKVSDEDAYKKFLKDRKPVDKRALDEEGDETIGDENVEEGKKGSGWTSAEDLALLNALKAFPKDVAMRWEKITASVPGKTKSACMKRVVELKKDFRSSKAQAS